MSAPSSARCGPRSGKRDTKGETKKGKPEKKRGSSATVEIRSRGQKAVGQKAPPGRGKQKEGGTPADPRDHHKRARRSSRED